MSSPQLMTQRHSNSAGSELGTHSPEGIAHPPISDVDGNTVDGIAKTGGAHQADNTMVNKVTLSEDGTGATSITETDDHIGATCSSDAGEEDNPVFRRRYE